MNTTGDFLSEKVDSFFHNAVKEIDGTRNLNGIATFMGRDGVESAVPLDAHVFLSDNFVSKFPKMLFDSATLAGVPPVRFLELMMLAKCGDTPSPFSCDGWPEYVFHRLHHMRPNYIVICARAIIAEVRKPKLSNQFLSELADMLGIMEMTKPRPHLIVQGVNPVHCYTRMAPIEGPELCQRVGKSFSIDSIKDNRVAPGPLTNIYDPSEN